MNVRNMTWQTWLSALVADPTRTDRRIPGEEDGHGPLALHSPSTPPPSYRDEGDDLESAPLNGGLQVDTEIPNARPKRKASKGCCVCCGIK